MFTSRRRVECTRKLFANRHGTTTEEEESFTITGPKKVISPHPISRTRTYTHTRAHTHYNGVYTSEEGKCAAPFILILEMFTTREVQ